MGDVCRLEKIQTKEGKKDCEDICSERYCCFESSRMNCYIDNQGWCDEFSSCKNLNSLSTTSGGSSSNSNNPQQEEEKEKEEIIYDKDIEKKIDTICSKENIKTSSGLE